MTHEIEITRSGKGGSRLLIDGKNISNYATDAFLHIGSRGLPELTIGLITPSILVTDPDVNVKLKQEERDILIALGWTPPND